MGVGMFGTIGVREGQVGRENGNLELLRRVIWERLVRSFGNPRENTC